MSVLPTGMVRSFLSLLILFLFNTRSLPHKLSVFLSFFSFSLSLHLSHSLSLSLSLSLPPAPTHTLRLKIYNPMKPEGSYVLSIGRTWEEKQVIKTLCGLEVHEPGENWISKYVHPSVCMFSPALCFFH